MEKEWTEIKESESEDVQNKGGKPMDRRGDKREVTETSNMHHEECI